MMMMKATSATGDPGTEPSLPWWSSLLVWSDDDDDEDDGHAGDDDDDGDPGTEALLPWLGWSSLLVFQWPFRSNAGD